MRCLCVAHGVLKYPAKVTSQKKKGMTLLLSVTHRHAWNQMVAIWRREEVNV